MTPARSVFLLIVIAVVTACSPDIVKKPDRKMLIRDDRLVALLTDTYLAGAVLEVPQVRDTWGRRDSLDNYNDVLESHGCTREQLDATLYYYFASKPRKMTRIFDRVNANLLEMEAGLDQPPVRTTSGMSDNLWNGKTSYNLPDDFTKDPVWFDIKADSAGTYIFRADYTVYPDDKSLDPRVTIYSSIVNENGQEETEYWDEVKLEKTGKTQRVEIRKAVTSGGAHIKGWLLNHTSQQGIWEKHARVRNISIKFEGEQAYPER